MAAINFPDSPEVNDLFSAAGTTWKWDGSTWTVQRVGLQGTQGVQGETGTQGTQGTDGTQGTQGTDGTQGTQGTQGAVGPGVPTGGLEGQILAKSSNTDYATTWINNFAEELYYLVRNNTGSTISKGTVLAAVGAEPSGRIDVAPFETTGTQDSELRVMGVALTDIANGVNGYVMNFGTLKNIDTRGNVASAIAVGDETWAEGDILFAHPTVAGKLTKVRPQHDLAVAFITVRHGSTGQMAVRVVPGNFHLEWLHDVDLTGVQDGYAITYNAAQGVWQATQEVGPQGAQGVEGAQGIAGAQGLDGSNGAQGTEGAQGQIGTQGAEGAQGAVGTQGLEGAQGTEGVQGTNGAVLGTLEIQTAKTGNYTLASGDENDVVQMNVGSANTLSIPTDATFDFAIGTQINVLQVGAGQTTIAAVTPGTTTVNGTPGLKLRAQWSMATCIKRAANTWVVVGDLSS